MPDEVLTKHNFTLSSGELLIVRYIANKECRNLTGAVRSIIRAYGELHDAEIIAWVEGGMGR